MQQGIYDTGGIHAAAVTMDMPNDSHHWEAGVVYDYGESAAATEAPLSKIHAGGTVPFWGPLLKAYYLDYVRHLYGRYAFVVPAPDEKMDLCQSSTLLHSRITPSG